MREQGQWRMRLPFRSWYISSEPEELFNSGLIPNQLQVWREKLAHLGTPQPLDCWNIEVVGDLHDDDEGDRGFEYSWSITEAKDEATHARQYDWTFIWAFLMTTSSSLYLDCYPIYQSFLCDQCQEIGLVAFMFAFMFFFELLFSYVFHNFLLCFPY